MTNIALAAAVFIAILGPVFWVGWKTTRNGEWYSASPTTLKRFIHGRWEFRDKTQAEMDEYNHSEAW